MRFVNRLRRIYLITLRKNKVIESLKKRKGVCEDCSLCCNNCKYLDGDKCSIYDYRICLRPFPIDETEQKLFGIYGKCKYYWEKD